MKGTIHNNLVVGMLLIFCWSGCVIFSEEIMINNEHKSIYNVLDYGAKGDAVADDTKAFQNAIDEAGKNELGGTVFVPKGNYLIKGHIELLTNVTLQGIWEIPTARTQMKGSTLLAVEGEGSSSGTPFINLNHNSTVKGITIFYPNQTKTNPPKQYPWTIASGGADNCSIVDVLIVNPYQAVDFGTKASGRHYIRNLYAQPLYKGLYIDNCFDVGRVENVHFWPFWGEDKPLVEFMTANATAFIIARTDWEFMNNCFCILYKIGFHFISGASGPGNALLTQCGSDVGPIAVLVDEVQFHSGTSFVNGQFYGVIDIKESNMGMIKFTGCGFFGTTVAKENEVSHAVIKGNGHVSFDNCHFVSIDPKNKAKTNILLDGGTVSITDSVFIDVGVKHLVIEEDTPMALLTSCTFAGKPNIINKSKGNICINNNIFNMPKEEPDAIIVDNLSDEPEFRLEGKWYLGRGGKDYNGNVHWTFKGEGEAKAFWRPCLPKTKEYDVYIYYGADPNNNHAKDAEIKIKFYQGEDIIKIDQTSNTGKWNYLGTYKFKKGSDSYITISNKADNNVVADAVKFVPKKKKLIEKFGF